MAKTYEDIISLIEDNIINATAKGSITKEKVGEILSEISLFANGKGEGITNDFPDSLYITDYEGYIFLSITKEDGEYNINYVGKGGNLYNYELYTIGDSLSVAGVWQSKLSSITGCSFDESKNANPLYPLSAGGTATARISETGGLWRAKNLIDKGYVTNGGEDTIILLQNVNDSKEALGNKNDKVIEPKRFISGEYQLSQWGESLLSSVPVAERDFNSVLKLYTNVNGVNVSITTLPIKEGNVDLVLKWTKASDGSTYATSHYSINVKPMATDEETRQFIIDRILEYSYVNADDSLNANGTSVDFANNLGDLYPLQIMMTDVDNTGMTISASAISTAKKFSNRLFIGLSLDEWTDTSKWISQLSVYQSWKSIISYLQKKLPNAIIAIVGLPYCDVKQTDYLLSDGTYEIDSWESSDNQKKYKALYECYKDVADMYNIPFIDISKDCGISIVNANKYYYTNQDGYTSGNIHPKNEGYFYFGTCLSRKLLNYLN